MALMYNYGVNKIRMSSKCYNNLRKHDTEIFARKLLSKLNFAFSFMWWALFGDMGGLYLEIWVGELIVQAFGT